MTASTSITPAIAGDHVPLRLTGVYVEGRGSVPRPGHTVLPRCDEPSGHGFFCLSCRAFLANVGQLEIHTERGGHVIAHACDIHGAEAPQ